MLRALKNFSKKNPLAGQATGTFCLKISLIGLSFATSIYIARLLSVSDYGLYNYAMAWLMLLQIPSSLGIDLLLGRELAAYRVKSDLESIRGMLRWSNRIVLLTSSIISIVAICLLLVIQYEANSQNFYAISLALAMLPIMALTKLRQGAMRGFDKVVKGQLPETFIQPVLFILILLASSLLISKSLTPHWIIGLRFISVAIAFAYGIFCLNQAIPDNVKTARPKYKSKRWLSSVIPFMFISCAHIINSRTDTIMLGALTGTEAVGIYTVASRGAELATFGLVAINMSLGPKVVAIYSKGNRENLQKLITNSTRMIMGITIPIVICLILLGTTFLQLFGTEFVQGKTALTILSIGQLVNAFCGSSGVILSMTGHERDSATGIGLSAILNVILNSALIPRYGLEGAAAASAISLVFWNIFLVTRVKQRLKINSTFFNTKLFIG
ncbi:MAG: flippase [Elainellaceae cyanobacterium]